MTNPSTSQKLREMSDALAKIRDDQTEIKCHDKCMCNEFDLIRDMLDALAVIFDKRQ